MIKRIISFYKYQNKWLVEYSKESGMSINAIIRFAVDLLKFQAENTPQTGQSVERADGGSYPPYVSPAE